MTGSRTHRPNVLFVLTDDQGAWAMGCAGNPEIRTPTLDRLAAEGARFERFFCASPVCSPARASLLTGQVPSAHGVHDYLRSPHVGPDATDYLAGRQTLLDVLSDAGYDLALSGKWHLGASDRPRPGFVHWFAHEGGGGPYRGAPMFRGTQPETVPGYLTDALADDAIGFLRGRTGSGDAGRPFFLSLSFTAPHSPWAGHHPAEVEALYDDCDFASCPQEEPHPWLTLAAGSPLGGEPDTRAALRGYFAAVTAMDAALGRVLDVLEELDLAEETLVVFTSDNGFNAGHHGIWGKGNGTWPLTMYDTSVTVPFVVRFPGRVGAGVVRDDLVSAYDLAATLLDLIGLDPGPMETGPGRSFADLVVDRPAGAATGSRTDRVVVFDEYGPTRMVRTRDWKYVDRWPDGPHELYDLRSDPDERVDLSRDPSHREVLATLAAELEDWFDRHATPELDGRRLPVIGTGQAAPVGTPEAFQGPLWDRRAGDR